MERLTHERANGIKRGYWSPNKKDELIDRLAEYENTGLTAAEINKMKRKYRRYSWCSNAFPMDEEPVLVTVNGKLRNVEFRDAILFATYSADEGWILEDYPECEYFTVNAWMYLPGPYRPEEVEHE